ncbi:MAG: non-canonical purine NTP pyrophosphatase [Minisyncoccales bacterium]
MTLYFITGNKGKFEQAKKIIPEVEQIDFDLPEIQSLDLKEIIEFKLNEASKNTNKEVFCEDISLEINCLNGLPGPLIKWFLNAIGNKGIYDLIKDKEDNSAKAKIVIGYKNNDDVVFFEEELKGEIVFPKGDKGFGWDSVFRPKGFDKTLGEMDLEEKMKINMRGKALLKLKNYLQENKK